jgi:hypothetical protein
MSKKILLLPLFISLCLPLAAQQVEADEAYYAASQKTYTAIKWQPFALGDIYSGDNLDYTIDPASFTTYHGSFWHKWGIRLNVDLDIDDNFVGKMNRIVGLLGFKRFSIRASTGSLSGTARWNGETIPGHANEQPFNSSFTTIELLYDFYYPDDPSTVVYSNGVPVYGLGKTGVGRGTYIGLIYNTVEFPVQISVSPGYQNITTKDTFDTVKFNNYGLIFGFDNLDGWFMYGQKNESRYTRGFSIWLSSYISVWGGWAEIRSSTINKLQELNPEIKVYNATLFTLGLQLDLTLGPCYLIWIGKVQCGIALGYEFSGRFIASGNGNRETEGTISTAYGYYRHGVVFKTGFSF